MDSFYTTCNQIDTDLGLNLYHDYLVMPGVEGFEQTTFPVLLDDSPSVSDSLDCPKNC